MRLIDRAWEDPTKTLRRVSAYAVLSMPELNEFSATLVVPRIPTLVVTSVGLKSLFAG